MPLVQDECLARCDEFELLLNDADERWRLLQVRLEETEENFLEDKLQQLKKWFGIDEEDLQNWNVGSLRHSIRGRLQRIIVAPLNEKMTQRVPFVLEEQDAEATESKAASSNLMEDLLKYWRMGVKPVVGEAKSEDEKLMKKIRKTEKDEAKQGVMALNGDTKKVAALKRQRPALWEPTQSVLEKLATPMKRVASFFSDEMPEESVARMIGAVPSIVSRAICDYYFQRCTMDLDQLENWWKKSKQTLQSKANLWEKLQEQEPRLLRNVEAGLEDLCHRRHRYNMYATFGGSEIEVLRDISSQKLEESVSLLSNVVSEMHKRLRMIRDSALWRIVESAQGLHKELRAEAANVEVWPTVGSEEGVLALAEAISCPTEEASSSQASGFALSEEELSDAALVVMGRLEKLVGLSMDIKDYFEKTAPTGCKGISATLDALVSNLSGVNEELLCLLDDPTPECLRAWLSQWAGLSETDRGQQIETAMTALPLKHDAELTSEARRVRRRWLSLLRGVQVLLHQDAVRTWAITPLGEVEPGSPTGRKPSSEAGALQDDVDELDLSTPPSPRGVLLAPPAGGLPYKPPERGMLSGNETLAQGAAVVPMGNQSGLRPETPSTTCEDAVENRPKSPGKFVDGEYVSLRPTSASMRLPPIPAVRPTL